METFLQLPAELQTHVLCYLSQHELAFLFDLTSLLENKCPHKNTQPKSHTDHGLEMLKHQALFAMFYKKPLLLSNDFASKSMPLCHLRQLIDMGIHITPSEVNINVFDFTDFEGSFSLWECFSASLFQFMSRLDSRFNIELVLWENVPLDTNLLRAWLDPLIKHGIEVTNCKIRYSSSLGFVPSRNTEPFNDYKIIEDTGAMSVENLHLNFFGPSEICRQLSPQKPCINLDSIQYLDLSFNQLTDMDLRSIQFPKALKELNLSNNSISVFDSESLPFETLSELKILDLSNNNIMRLDICSPRDQICSSVQVLNLSGNFLSTYSPLFGGPLFSGLQEIDLSHNLISQLSGFTESLKRVNLTGNYITKQPEPSALCFSKNLEVLGIDRFLVDALYETENTQPSCKA